MPPEMMMRVFRSQSGRTVYDHEAHVALGEALAARKALPKTFSALSLSSWSDDVWTDITRMKTLNADQASKGREKHVCPLQIDIVDRVIRLYSNPGDLVFDPFGGIMTVPYRALHLRRRGVGVELEPKYFRDGVRYLRSAEAEVSVPSLLDILEHEEAA